MIRLNIHEAKTHLSRYLKELAKDETIILCKRNIPIAEIRPIRPRMEYQRPIGLGKGEFEGTSKFFEPLPEEVVDAFNGHNA